MAIEAVLFDMDGVVVDTEDFWRDRETNVVLPKSVAAGDPTQDEIRGINYRETYDYLADNYELAVSREEFLELYESAAEELYGERAELMAGFPELLATLRARGVKTAIVSSSPHSWITLVIDRFGLEVDALVSTEDVNGPGKPAPDVYEFAARTLGVEPDSCLSVEDSPNGVRAATRAGTTCIAYGGDPEATELADVAVSSPEELRTVFEEYDVLPRDDE